MGMKADMNSALNQEKILNTNIAVQSWRQFVGQLRKLFHPWEPPRIVLFFFTSKINPVVSKTFMRLSCFVLQHKSHIQSNLSLCLLKPKSCYINLQCLSYLSIIMPFNKKVSSGNSHHSLHYFLIINSWSQKCKLFQVLKAQHGVNSHFLHS